MKYTIVDFAKKIGVSVDLLRQLEFSKTLVPISNKNTKYYTKAHYDRYIDILKKIDECNIKVEDNVVKLKNKSFVITLDCGKYNAEILNELL